MCYSIRSINASRGGVARLGRPNDIEYYEEMEIIAQLHNQVSCLSHGKINGKCMWLDRPYDLGANENNWASSAPYLIHWGGYSPLLTPYIYGNGLKLALRLRLKQKWVALS